MQFCHYKLLQNLNLSKNQSTDLVGGFCIAYITVFFALWYELPL